MGIADLVNTYTDGKNAEAEILQLFAQNLGQDLAIAKNLDTTQAKYEPEFWQRYSAIFTYSVRQNLIRDITELTKKLLERYESRQVAFIHPMAVRDVFANVEEKALLEYNKLRSRGIEPYAAFEEAIKPLGDLVNAVIAGDLSAHPVYTDVEIKLRFLELLRPPA